MDEDFISAVGVIFAHGKSFIRDLGYMGAIAIVDLAGMGENISHFAVGHQAVSMALFRCDYWRLFMLFRLWLILHLLRCKQM